MPRNMQYKIVCSPVWITHALKFGHSIADWLACIKALNAFTYNLNAGCDT